MVLNYDEFREKLREIGFLLFGGGGGQVLELSDMVRPESWHTQDKFTDPWAWKDMLAASRTGAYVRVLDGRATLIDEAWIPRFIAAFRAERSLQERYGDGLVDPMTLRMSRLFEERSVWARHELTAALGIHKENKGVFERALIQLQREMTMVMSGQAQRISKEGLPYGWASMEYTALGAWARPEWLEEAGEWTREAARLEIREQLQVLSPQCPERTLKRLSGIGAIKR